MPSYQTAGLPKFLLGRCGSGNPEWAILFFKLEIIRRLLEQLITGIKNSIVADGNIKRLSRVQSIIYLLPLPITYLLFYFGFQPYWQYIIWILFLNIIASYNIIKQAKKYCNLNIKSFLQSIIIKCLTCTIIIVSIGYIPHYLLSPNLIRVIIVGLVTSFTYIIIIYIAIKSIFLNVLRVHFFTNIIFI